MNANPNPTKRPIQKAVAEWEALNNNKKISEETHVNLIFNGILDVDSATLNSFTACVKLSLSSNFISKIQDIHLKNLKILSLGRNKLKAIKGLDFVGNTLEQLWLSYNEIERLDGLNNLLNLEVLYMANNMIAKSDELNKISNLTKLRDVLFRGNPFTLTDGDIKKSNNEKDRPTLVKEICKRLNSVSILDSEIVDRKMLEETP